MQESRNFVITDETLQVAAEEVAMAMLNIIPKETHSFSARFEKKMQRLLRRAKHPVFYQVMRYAAVIVLAVTVLFGAVFAVSPTVRAAVIGWVQSVFYEFFEYAPQETVPPDVEYEYYLPDSFDDYSLMTTIDEQEGKTYIFMSKQGKLLRFTYTYSGDTSMYLNTENTDAHEGTVGAQSADIYISKTGMETNAIVWQDSSNNVLLILSAFADQNELPQLAEKVQKREKQ